MQEDDFHQLGVLFYNMIVGQPSSKADEEEAKVGEEEAKVDAEVTKDETSLTID